jgi:hypothetical protein
MRGHKPGSHVIRWTREECAQLARALATRYPLRSYDSAASAADIDFTLDEFNAIQKRVLPRERRRTIQKLDVLQRQIYETLTDADFDLGAPANAPEPAQPPGKKTRSDDIPVKWTPQEYKQYALALHHQHPHLHLLHATTMNSVTTGMMNRAAATLPEGRQRKFPALEQPRRILLELYAKARAERDPLFFPPFELPAAALKPAPPPAPVSTPAPMRMNAIQQRMFQRAPKPAAEVPRVFEINETKAVSAPAAPAAEAEAAPTPAPDPVPAAAPRAIAAPPVTLPGASAPPRPARSPVHWTDAEWIAIALELHRMYPLLKLPGNTELHGLTSGDVAFAQRVLAPSRQRPNLKVVAFQTNCKRPLIKAFRAVKEGLAATPITGAVELDMAQAEPQPEKKEEEDAAPPAPNPTPPPLAATGANAAPHVNMYEAAFKPLVDAFGAQFAALVSDRVSSQVEMRLNAQLASVVAQLAALQEALTKLTPAPPASKFGAIFQTEKLHADAAAATAAPVPVPAPARENAAPNERPDYLTRHPTTPRTSAPKIGILGNRNTYHAELEKAFPGINFTCIDTPKKVDAVRNCEKVIAMTRWCTHSGDAKLKKAVGERYVPLNGGLTDLKRQIAVWIAAGVITPAMVDAPGNVQRPG